MKKNILLPILILIGFSCFSNNCKANNGNNSLNSSLLRINTVDEKCTVDVTIDMTFQMGNGTSLTTKVTFEDVPCDEVQEIEEIAKMYSKETVLNQ